MPKYYFQCIFYDAMEECDKIKIDEVLEYKVDPSKQAIFVVLNTDQFQTLFYYFRDKWNEAIIVSIDDVNNHLSYVNFSQWDKYVYLEGSPGSQGIIEFKSNINIWVLIIN